MTTYCFDIDGTLCSQVSEDYLLAKPHISRIKKVNELRAFGHTVKLFTARGSKSGLDWRDKTISQLLEWGLGYDELILGKPHSDFYIDDKAIHSEAFDWALESSQGS